MFGQSVKLRPHGIGVRGQRLHRQRTLRHQRGRGARPGDRRRPRDGTRVRIL